MSAAEEQRKDRRYPADILLRSGCGDDLVEMEAINISVGGVHCRSHRFIAPMTRFNITLDLPGSDQARPPLTIEAVVVRVERQPDSQTGPPFRLSLWFQRMEPADRARLRRFLGRDGN